MQQCPPVSPAIPSQLVLRAHQIARCSVVVFFFSGYDGGDCCSCTCSTERFGVGCFDFDFACIDPAAECVDDDDVTADMVENCGFVQGLGKASVTPPHTYPLVYVPIIPFFTSETDEGDDNSYFVAHVDELRSRAFKPPVASTMRGGQLKPISTHRYFLAHTYKPWPSQ